MHHRDAGLQARRCRCTDPAGCNAKKTLDIMDHWSITTPSYLAGMEKLELGSSCEDELAPLDAAKDSVHPRCEVV